MFAVFVSGFGFGYYDYLFNTDSLALSLWCYWSHRTTYTI